MLRAFLVIIAAMSSVAAASERSVAEWILRAGGSVVVEDGPAEIWDIAQLPAGDIQVRAINLVATTLKPKDFEHLSHLGHLRELYVSGRTWHSLPAAMSVESLGYLASLTGLETLALSLPVQTE